MHTDKLLALLTLLFCSSAACFALPDKKTNDIFLEFFPESTGQNKNAASLNLPFEAYLGSAAQKFPGRQVIALIESGENKDTTFANKIGGRMAEYSMILPPRGKLKAPVFVIDGARAAGSDAKSVQKAVEESTGLNIVRQPMQVQAWNKENRLKASVTVNYKRFATEAARLIIFIAEDDDKKPLVRQIEDVGYLAPGHMGNSIHTFTLDKSWFEANRGKSERAGLKVVAILQQFQTNKIFGVAQCRVEKSKGGWF